MLCLQVIEIIDHLLLNCPFAQDRWHFFLHKLNFHIPLPNSLWDLFQAWTILYSKLMFSCLWKCIPASIVWKIWWETNKRIFRQTSSLIPQFLEGLERSIIELVNASVSKYNGKHVFSPWDGCVIHWWKGLLFLIFLLYCVHLRFLLSEHKPSGFSQVRLIRNSILMGHLGKIEVTLLWNVH